jgi:hypothetical protein
LTKLAGGFSDVMRLMFPSMAGRRRGLDLDPARGKFS